MKMKKQYFIFQLKCFFTNPKNIGLFVLTFILSLYFGLVSVPNRQIIEKVDPYAIKGEYQRYNLFLKKAVTKINEMQKSKNAHEVPNEGYVNALKTYPAILKFDKHRLHGIKTNNWREYAIYSSRWYKDVDHLIFVDEIHRMPIAVEEILYPAMEDFKLDLVLGQGPGARTVKIELEPFTLVGATTRMGLISSPLRDRFGILAHLEFYSPEDLSRIVLRTAKILGVVINNEGAAEIGRRSRGTPRIANRLLRRVRDFALVHGDGNITAAVASKALEQMDVDELGLDQMDRKILNVIIRHYDGGPVGVRTLAAACSEEIRTIEEIYEPFLIQSGFLKRTPRGRMATSKAFKHLKLLG